MAEHPGSPAGRHSNDASHVSPTAVAVTSLEPLETESQDHLQSPARAIDEDPRMPVLFRHSGWHPLRKLVAASFLRTEQPWNRRREFYHCGSHSYVLESLTTPGTYRVAGSCCRDRFCVPCSTERSAIIGGNALELLRGKNPRFLTLTIKTKGLSLEEGLKKIYGSFGLLRRRAVWTRAVRGGVAFLEIKWNEELQRWHPHFHCLITGTWIDRKKLVAAWYAVTGDSFVLDIRRPPNDRMITRYVTKYASKPLNTTFSTIPERLDEAVRALKGRKLCVTFGTWRGERLTQVEDTGEWTHVDTLENVLTWAAHGDEYYAAILRSLTDRDLSSILSRAPPGVPPLRFPSVDHTQHTFFGTWSRSGEYSVPTPTS